MNLQLIAYFVAAAAQAMFINQPNLSKQIALLEQKVGARLFYREHRTVRLTPAGQRFYDLVHDIPGRLEAAVREAGAEA